MEVAHECIKCNARFKTPWHLRRHLARKTPCERIIVDTNGGASIAEKPFVCRHCGRQFANQPSRSRHVSRACKVAKEANAKETETNMHANLAVQRQLNEMQAQLAALTKLLENQLPAPGAIMVAPLQVVQAAQVNTGPIAVQNVTQVIIRPWSTEERILIPAAMVKSAFTENRRLADYCALSDEEKVDPERAAPYVLEALLELVKRAHAADPAARNIYLNPCRADQVYVFDEETWRVMTLIEAIRDLFDSVAGRLHVIMVTDAERKQLPFEVQASASWIPNMYEEGSEMYVERARAPISAHLANRPMPPQLIGC